MEDKNIYAVIEIGAKQFLVKQGDKITADKVSVKPGETLKVNEVLFFHAPTVLKLQEDVVAYIRREGEIDARTNPRTHVADITIKYSATSYGIEYKDSVNLLYDETNIHRNYNKWIQLLREQIDAKLSNALWPPASGT